MTNSLNDVEDVEDAAAAQVLNEAALNNGNPPMTDEEIHQLDSTLAAAGFKDDERASIIAQMKMENSGSGADEVNSENTVKGASDDE